MPKPVILAVDDEPAVLASVERDLRARYGRDFRILGAPSGRAALDALGALKLRNSPVALVVADQRMPGVTGVEVLERAGELSPEVKRVLLTAYADTDAAIRAINRARIDYYLLKPWDPPEERLYPIADDLLDQWWQTFQPPFEGVRLVGNQWSRQVHELRGFLVRNLVPHRWLDVERDPEATRLLEEAGVDAGRVPLVVLADGTPLVQPSPAALAERIGLHTRPELPTYDLVVVGAGPAGLAAGVYGASEGLSTVVLEQLAPGGQAGGSSRIENYLGFPVGLSGAELTRRAVTQVKRFGAELLVPQQAIGLRTRDGYHLVRLADGSELNARSMIIATGVAYRLLPAPGAEALTGAGVYYSAARPEAVAHAGEDVFIVGGGNSAGQAAMFLAGFARQVTILVRSADLAASMSRYLIDQIEATPNIAVRGRTQVLEAKGSDRLEALTLQDLDQDSSEEVQAGALFVFIGMAPRTDWVADVVERDSHGFVLSGADCGPKPRGWTLERTPLPLEASVPGIFVAGDVRHGSIKRVASAAGEGAMAVRFCHEHLSSS